MYQWSSVIDYQYIEKSGTDHMDDHNNNVLTSSDTKQTNS